MSCSRQKNIRSIVDRDYLIVAGKLMLLAAAVAWLFFRSIYGLVPMIPFSIWYAGKEKKRIRHKRQMEFAGQFCDCLQALETSLSVGNSIDRAWAEAETEMEALHGVQSAIVCEIGWILSARQNKQPMGELLLQMAARCGVKDVETFAQVFRYAGQWSGDFGDIIGKTCCSIRQKLQLQREAEDAVAAKKLEQQIMSLMPFAIIAYISVGNGEYLQPLYHNIGGVVVMGICFLIYWGALALGDRITDIRW